MPDTFELPGVLGAVVPLVRGERLARWGRGVVDELVALAFGHLAGLRRDAAAGRLPRLAAVARALDHLAEPPAGLRRIDAVGIGGGSPLMLDLPPRAVGAAHLPPAALVLFRLHESA